MNSNYLVVRRLRNWLFFCILVLTVLVVKVPVAQSQTGNAVQQKGAPVVLGDQTLFKIQAGIASFSPEFRAQVVSDRIAAFAKDVETSPDTLIIVENAAAQTVDIRAGEQTLVTVAPVDAVAAEQSGQQLAAEYLPKIQTAVTEFRAAHSLQNIIRGGIYTVIATVVFVASLILIGKLPALLNRRLRRAQETRVPALRLLGTEILSSRRVVDLLSEVIKIFRLVLALGLLYLYVNLVLSFFPWTQGLSRILFGYLLSAVSTLAAGLISYLPNLFFLAIIGLFTSYALKVIRFFFTEIEQGGITFPGFYAEWAKPTSKLCQFLIFAFAVTVAFPYLPGSGTPAFQGVSLFLGLLVSLGSSSAIANIFAGIILTYTRAFQVGDRVKITNTIGDIVEKTLFVTRIRTIKNVVITIPNAAVLGSHIVNYSSAASDPETPPLILHTTITLGYDVPWRKVHQVLLQAALASPEILAEPAPFVLQTSLDDFYVSYELNAYTDNPSIMAKIYSALHQNIQDQCNEADIEILSPHYRAMRDGNQTTIPENYLPRGSQAPSFRVASPSENSEQNINNFKS